ncbi:Uma2 family endonuclease [Argonema galeatum]|uniref:Uma2 family endonuclease n=1 Tax=Argonema galeatum TaxID=2942762 RepID=UPI00201271DF|nr:Uma2 family endonuclease [Argonema galeatum]MCL1468045.1 Uma2 family endonuclease [Argonema galeatum A003/A1]
MVQYNPPQYLPTAEELLESDEKAVDDELQNLIPNLLLSILALMWSNRQDWFFGVDMGIYHTSDEPAIVPDGFLSLGVQRLVGEQGRLSYVVWQENGVIPILVLEVVSKTYRGEYKQKKIDYAELGVLYYVIYKPVRYHSRRGDAFEVHKLVNGEYIRQTGEPVWMPEICLGIGRETGIYKGWMREWLFWYDENGRKYLSPDELIQQAEQRAERLAAKLRELGVEPEED